MKLKRFTTQLAVAGLIALPLAAHAAGLGKLSVKSALGQPLSAEIELYAADKAELESLSATLASDQAFRDAHVEFAPILSSLSFSIAKKPNGKAVLKVSSSRPVTDPFVDLLIELNWSSGRLVREYTMLLDPPGTAKAQAAAPVAVTAAQTPSAKPAPEPKPAAAPAVDTQASAAAGKAADEPKAAPDHATTKRGKPQPAPAATEPKAAPDQVTVKRGDTLGNIANRVRPDGVSLEQTLLGLYRENPRAFDGNMNRLKAGKTLAVPSTDAIAAIPQKEAVRELKLQADDWRAYRQKLAGAVSAATPEAQPAPSQASSGKITPKVEDRAKPAAEAQKDVLKLSKAVPPASATKAEAARAADEDATAHQKSVAESSARAAMLEKQIGEMQKLAEMKETAKAEPAAEPAPAPAAVQPAPAPAAAEHKPAPAPAVQAPPAAPEPSENWYDPLLADPLYWGGGLAALGLGGVLWWMMAGNRRRKPAPAALEDSLISVGEMRPVAAAAAPAASGGSINTGDTSFLTDFSQAGLGAIDTHDVDPIAEAEVYMAYGRDAQAEEILKEAIAKNPDRHEVRVKLLEIYAARRNATAFEAAAGELYASLGSKPSPLWDKACEMGRSIDPTNPLYGGGQPSAAPAAATVAATAAVVGGAVSFDTAPAPAAAVPEPDTIFDLDLAPQPARASEPEPEPVIESAPLEFENAGSVLNFDVQPEVEASRAPAPAETGYVEMDTQGLSFDLPDLDLPAATNEPLKLDLGQTDDNGPDSGFDFSGLDLDLAGAGNELELDEVGTKLDLARAYVEMGDKEGAREILNEVLNEGNDKQRADAKGMMSALG